MISSIEISGIGYQIDKRTHAYILKKIGRLDKYLPSHARKTVSAEVKLKEVNRDHGNKYEAEVIVVVPDKTITAKDSTVNMIAAIDIVEAKIVPQLRRYKQASVAHLGNRRLLRRFKRAPIRES